jgi:hypothetical protein
MSIVEVLNLATAISPGGLPTPEADSAMIKSVLKVVFAIIGALSLLMITVSGLNYITSAGEPDKASRAKNGIIFALIGLAIALAAEALVTFVVGNL